MNTPICDFVKEYAEKKAIRLHMPGHKGKAVLGPEYLDITEIGGADVLYHSKGIILESEKNAARLFGTKKTVYSCEGSSLCIRAMLYLAKLYAAVNGQKPHILAARNVHKTFVSAAALLDIDVSWLYSGRPGVLECRITEEELEKSLSRLKPAAVYITSPDYIGNVADVKMISTICHKHGAILMVDNAHGAYLKFLPQSMHPIDLGADICCDSAHKTLPALTGAAYLHISENAPGMFAQRAEEAMSVFASTSPSYLILQSLDMANAKIETSAERFSAISRRVESLKSSLSEMGFELAGNEPMKLTICPKSYGYTGEELGRILEESNIVSEFSDPDYLVMMFSVQTAPEEIDFLETAFRAVARREKINTLPPVLERPEIGMKLGEVFMSPRERIDISASEGRILASAEIACPPAVPIVVCGERINPSCIECFKYYGIEEICVVC